MAYEEDEVVENLKLWWKKNGTALMLLVAVGLFSFAGWRYWQTSQAEAATQAQNLQQAMQIAAQRLNTDPNDKDTVAEVTRLGEQLIADYSGTPYAQDAAMLLAKVAVNSNDLAKAISLLQGVVADSSDDVEVALAQTRLARVQAANADYDAALSTLAAVRDASLAPLVSEIKGDIFMLQAMPAEAKAAYQAADAALAARNEVRPLLELKLADVGLEPAPRAPLALEQ
ncbi:putative negative regulator of RcsB-dependent stress response [Paraperlucidibaca baekdonensis]|uniref:Ancillary SecYEG translocon subunit n=1 Tax=Paraperlucidibaca baekdonensis TaxID=748120 RepID=A0A3E0H715_9GAMM|nr:tetratricopeptide repeat protein [Paraperlucidibaca baekdonensis]REH38824.1 putative negative regulator of RcsB-dependent stress response [Paraperlucidibaca baekdonensis]